MRRASPDDLPAITLVRTSVRENHLSVEQMAERGITHESLTQDMNSGHLAAWVVEAGGVVVAFAMADRLENRIFALFTHPTAEGHGYGSKLLHQCEQWLEENGATEIRLDTGRGTRAHQFYTKRGWREDDDKSEDLSVELVKRV